MGELYLARTSGIEGFEKVVVLKRIHPQFASRSDFEQMLLDEARLMATLHHPNIVQVYDVGRHEGCTFFTMEYVHGDNLRNVLKTAARKGRGLSLANALWIVTNVAAGLHYAHQKRRPDGTALRLIHRDVSPGNIMVSHDGAVKLVDFGVAKATVRTARTAPGAIKGHVRYMSPEQCLGNAMDHRSDQFSLGIVLFELTTGTRWIRERDDYDAVRRMLSEPFPKPSERRVKYPVELEQIVMRALARQPDDRFESSQEFQLALEAYARENKLALSAVSMGETMRALFDVAAEYSTQHELHKAGAAPGAALGAQTLPMNRSPLAALVVDTVPPTVPGAPPMVASENHSAVLTQQASSAPIARAGLWGVAVLAVVVALGVVGLLWGSGLP
ncbi:MAG: hypothetical protein RJA70_4338 [Pseudomonadota bacterium]|jgi:serine/threonine protein kinase